MPLPHIAKHGEERFTVLAYEREPEALHLEKLRLARWSGRRDALEHFVRKDAECRQSVTLRFELAPSLQRVDHVSGHVDRRGLKARAVGHDQAERVVARTIGQDESSCVVYGMSRVAAEIGACEMVLPLEKIGLKVLDLCSI